MLLCQTLLVGVRRWVHKACDVELDEKFDFHVCMINMKLPGSLA